MQPLFEFSGACVGCGETSYIRLASQLFGDRMLVANATGCSSIYGGNLPTTPWTKNAEGRGPSWNNSLFEDNAEFGLGMRLAVNKQGEYAAELLQTLSGTVDESLIHDIDLATRRALSAAHVEHPGHEQLSVAEQLYLMQLYLARPQRKHGDAASFIVGHAQGIGLLVAHSLHAHGLLLLEMLLLL